MCKLVTILGPTATGKTFLAAHLAHKIGGEIISADSRQVYKGMDIGTGKDIDDYFVNDRLIPYHMVDIANPGYEYNVFEFQRDFIEVFNDIVERGKKPIMSGGTGLYLDAILKGYKLIKVPENVSLRKRLDGLTNKQLNDKLLSFGKTHNTTDLTDRQRTIRAIEICEFKKLNPDVEAPKLNIKSINFGIKFERQELRERITKRLKIRLEEGMIQEVKDLLNTGLKPEQLTFYGLEYRFVTQYLTGEIPYDVMFRKLNTAIHQFAKRQETWYRRMEKMGSKIYWLDGNLPIQEKLSIILDRI